MQGSSAGGGALMSQENKCWERQTVAECVWDSGRAGEPWHELVSFSHTPCESYTIIMVRDGKGPPTSTSQRRSPSSCGSRNETFSHNPRYGRQARTGHSGRFVTFQWSVLEGATARGTHLAFLHMRRIALKPNGNAPLLQLTPLSTSPQSPLQPSEESQLRGPCHQPIITRGST